MTSIFEYVIFDTVSGKIDHSLTNASAGGDVTLNVNSTGIIEKTFFLPGLKSAVYKSLGSTFKPWTKGLAVLRLNSSGQRIGAIAAGIIQKQEINLKNETIYVQSVEFSEYTKNIPVYWTSDGTFYEGSSVNTISGRPDEIYNSLINQAINQAPSGVKTIPVKIDTSSGDTRTGSYKINPYENISLNDAINEVRDTLFSGKSAEYRFDAYYDTTNNKVGWAFRTSATKHFNYENTALNIALYASENPEIREVTEFQTSLDGQEMYNYFTMVAGTGTETSDKKEIKTFNSKNVTDDGEITLFNFEETDEKPDGWTVQGYLDAYTDGSYTPTMDGSITLSGQGNINWIPYSYVTDGTITHVNDYILGRKIKTLAGSRSSGMSVKLRVLEISFNDNPADLNLKLTLSTIANAYPEMPSSRKGGSKTSKKKKKSNSLNGPKPNWGAPSGDGKNPQEDGGIDAGEDKPNKPEPERLEGLDKTELTVSSSIVNRSQTNSSGLQAYFTNPLDETELWSLSASNTSLGFTNAEVTSQATTKTAVLTFLQEAKLTDTNYTQPISNLMRSNGGTITPRKFTYTFSYDWVLKNIWNSAGDLKEYSNYASNVTTLSAATLTTSTIQHRTRFFIVKKRVYGQSILYLPTVSGRTVTFTEAFFSLDFNEDFTALTNLTRLAGPAEQLYNTQRKGLVIALNWVAGFYPVSPMQGSNSLVQWFDYSGGEYKQIIFPYTNVYGTRCTSTNGAITVYHTKLMEYYNTTPSLMKGNIGGFLQADFTVKQPIWSINTNELPIPKTEVHTTARINNQAVGEVNSTVNYNTSADGVSPIGAVGYYPRNGYSFTFSANRYGATISTHLSMSNDNLWVTFKGLDTATAVEKQVYADNVTSDYLNKVFHISPKGEWKAVPLPTTATTLNQISYWATAMPGDTLITYVNKYDKDYLNGMDGSGLVMTVDTDTSVGTGLPINPIRGYNENNMNVDSNIFNELPGLTSEQTTPAVRIGTIKPNIQRLLPTVIGGNLVSTDSTLWMNYPRFDALEGSDYIYNYFESNAGKYIIMPYGTTSPYKLIQNNNKAVSVTGNNTHNFIVDTAGDIWFNGLYNGYYSEAGPGPSSMTYSDFKTRGKIKLYNITKELPYRFKKITSQVTGTHISNSPKIGLTNDGDVYSISVPTTSTLDNPFIFTKVNGNIKIKDIVESDVPVSFNNIHLSALLLSETLELYAVKQDNTIIKLSSIFNQSGLSAYPDIEKYTGMIKNIFNTFTKGNYTSSPYATTILFQDTTNSLIAYGIYHGAGLSPYNVYSKEFVIVDKQEINFSYGSGRHVFYQIKDEVVLRYCSLPTEVGKEPIYGTITLPDSFIVKKMVSKITNGVNGAGRSTFITEIWGEVKDDSLINSGSMVLIGSLTGFLYAGGVYYDSLVLTPVYGVQRGDGYSFGGDLRGEKMIEITASDPEGGSGGSGPSTGENPNANGNAPEPENGGDGEGAPWYIDLAVGIGNAIVQEAIDIGDRIGNAWGNLMDWMNGDGNDPPPNV